MDKIQRLASDLDFRVVADFFVSHGSDELAPTCEVELARYPPVFHASFSSIAELEKKSPFVNRRNISHHKHLLPRAFVLLGTANPLNTHSNRWNPSNTREVFSNG